MPYFGVTPSDAAGADLDGKELSNAASPDFIKPDSVYEKLQEISGEIQVLSAKIDGKKIR